MEQPQTRKAKKDKAFKKAMKKQKIKNLPWWRKAIRYTRKTLIYGVFAGLLAVGGVLAYAWHNYGPMVQSIVTEGYAVAETFDKKAFIQRQPTIVYDKDGHVLKELKESVSEYVDYEAINPYFKEGIVAVEDRRFHLHQGVDLYGTIRSMAATYIGGDTQGGSTLTQQLVRNVILNNDEVSIERKLKEQVVAQELEKVLSKEEIVQHYLNNVFFGNGNYGIAPASQFYFGKDQSELKPEEVAVIIGITNNPSLFDPINNPENAFNKRNRVLTTMFNEGVLTEKEYKRAVDTSIELDIHSHQLNNDVSDNDILQYTLHQATKDLMELDGFVFRYLFDSSEEKEKYDARYNESYQKHWQKIISGGYEIHTSIDMNKQKELESFVEKEMAKYPNQTEKGLFRTQLSMTTIDNETGEVVAIMGGRGQKEDHLNRAYQSPRQPGSASKPFVSYANAFELGYAPQSNVVDSEVPNGPSNWYKGYWGKITIRHALEQSVNTIAYKLANQVGTDVFMDKLAKMEFSHLTHEDKNPIISVGGFTHGVTTVEMASAYSTLARQGQFLEPTNVVEIKDMITKETILKKEKKPKQIWQEDAAYFTVDALKGVLTDGTGKQAQVPGYEHVFGKTGTTNGNKDSVFVGGTPYYTTAIWVGHDLPTALTSSELNLPKTLFSKWNEQLHKGLKVIDFDMPKSVTKKGDNLYSSLETYKDQQQKRKANEDVRMQQERAFQRERLSLEDYRIIYNLTTEEEKEREEKTQRAIDVARNYQLTEVDDYESWMRLIEEARKLNNEVKHQRAYDRFKAEIDEIEIRAAVEKDELLAEIKRKEEEERKREEEQQREQEIIQSLQQSLSTFLAKVEEGESLTEQEYSEMETIIRQLNEKGVDTPELQVEWIESEETEEEVEETEESPENDDDISSEEVIDELADEPSDEESDEA